MRKTWIAAIVALLALGIFFTALYMWTSPRGEPKLEVFINPRSPRNVYAGGNFELNITIINEGNSSAKNININITAPQSFTISESGTNNYSRVFPNLGVREKQSVILTITVSSATMPKEYSINVIISAENISKRLTFEYKINVTLPVS